VDEERPPMPVVVPAEENPEEKKNDILKVLLIGQDADLVKL